MDGGGPALLVDAINPQLIVLGSLAVVLGERILASTRRVLAQEALPSAVAVCEIKPSELGGRIGNATVQRQSHSGRRVRRSLFPEVALECERLFR